MRGHFQRDLILAPSCVDNSLAMRGHFQRDLILAPSCVDNSLAMRGHFQRDLILAPSCVDNSPLPSPPLSTSSHRRHCKSTPSPSPASGVCSSHLDEKIPRTIEDSTIEVLLPCQIGIVGTGREVAKGLSCCIDKINIGALWIDSYPLLQETVPYLTELAAISAWLLSNLFNPAVQQTQSKRHRGTNNPEGCPHHLLLNSIISVSTILWDSLTHIDRSIKGHHITQARRGRLNPHATVMQKHTCDVLVSQSNSVSSRPHAAHNQTNPPCAQAIPRLQDHLQPLESTQRNSQLRNILLTNRIYRLIYNLPTSSTSTLAASMRYIKDEEKPAVAQAHINQQLRRCSRYGISCDDISLDVITISRKLSADEKRSERDEATSCWRISRWFSVDDVIIISRWFERAVARISRDVKQVPSEQPRAGRSLGVLTAAGCGIGSVHGVVRSNILVEPSEVEEGEM
ncbi:hypothetical protein F511_37340 [Dorcoceras hygrometricum]|uniref:Uncharacterized protein n=1 Tax=Dorcoceras hygrometricum TaxID=472368 RepID=A0A2Z7AC26_9LAMI|nr:hypothetical protein F511_37340 [Dorcoceras hygrometricum]